MAVGRTTRNQAGRIPRLTVVVGKGGVGRSTVAAALGLTAARRGLRTLIVEVASRQSVPAMFDKVGAGYSPVELSPGLWSVRVTWEDALREYGLMKLKLRAAYRLVFENALVRRLLPAIPGIAEILIIGKIVYAATDGVPGLGRPDAVILDAPATGHGLALINAPLAVTSTVSAGPLADDAKRLEAVMRDPAFTSFQLVTTAEDMPVSETVELYQELGVRRGLPLGPLIVNAVQETGLTERQREALLLLLGGRGPPAGIAAATRAALFMDARYQVQRGHIERLRGLIPLPVVRLPELAGIRDSTARVGRLADHLDAVLWREAR